MSLLLPFDIYHKLRIIRFLPSDNDNNTLLFICGTWHETKNKLMLCSINLSISNKNLELESQINNSIIILTSKLVDYDITDISVLNSTCFIVSYINGNIILYNIDYDHDLPIFEISSTYNNNVNLKSGHKLSINKSTNQMIACNEKGTFNLFSLSNFSSINSSTSPSINMDCEWINNHEFLIAGFSLYCYDIRTKLKNSTYLNDLTKLHSGYTSLSVHPNQNYICAGRVDGNIEIYDVRKNSLLNCITISDGPIWELSFNNSKIYTACESGLVLTDFNSNTMETDVINYSNDYNVSSLYSKSCISLDYCTDALISAAENEKIVFYK